MPRAPVVNIRRKIFHRRKSSARPLLVAIARDTRGLHRWDSLVFSLDGVSRPRRARVQETMATARKRRLIYICRLAKATVSAKFSLRWKRDYASRDEREVREKRREGEIVTHKK